MITMVHGKEEGEKASLNLNNESQEKLTVTREEIVKGVVIKGIVCTPKSKQKSKSSSGSKTSLNPFEKRLAPSPPADSSLSDSVPKTKTKKRGFPKK